MNWFFRESVGVMSLQYSKPNVVATNVAEIEVMHSELAHMPYDDVHQGHNVGSVVERAHSVVLLFSHHRLFSYTPHEWKDMALTEVMRIVCDESWLATSACVHTNLLGGSARTLR